MYFLNRLCIRIVLSQNLVGLKYSLKKSLRAYCDHGADFGHGCGIEIIPINYASITVLATNFRLLMDSDLFDCKRSLHIRFICFTGFT